MKWLKEKTVIQFFLNRGGKLTEDGYWISLPAKYGFIYLNLYRQETLKSGKKDPSLEIHGCRWHKKGNVHIDSYWGWPRSVADLQKTWDEIRETYGTLCRFTWKSDDEVKWELARRKKEGKQLYDFSRRLKTWSMK